MNSNYRKILVIDGMGGGIGKSIVEKLAIEVKETHIIAAGTNPVAMSRMLDAGANEGITGEQAIINQIDKVDFIIGAMGILIPDGLSGEITQEMVLATCGSKAIKILIPMDRCGIRIATEQMPIAHYISHAVQQVKATIETIE